MILHLVRMWAARQDAGGLAPCSHAGCQTEAVQGAMATTGSTPVVAGAVADAATDAMVGAEVMPIAKASAEGVAKVALQQVSWVSCGRYQC